MINKLSIAEKDLTAAQIADIMEDAKAKAEAGRGKGEGDFTKDRRERPQQSFDEIAAGIMRVQSLMEEVMREHPEMSAGEITDETMNRMIA